MNSILIVTEQFTIGGLETHIRGEILALTKAGLKVHLATGRLFNDLLIPECLVSLSHHIPMELSISPNELLASILTLRQIIRENSIEFVHIHPFGSIFPAMVAAELEGIPAIITLHGPASLASYSPLYDFLLKEVILPNADLVAVSMEVKNLVSLYAEEKSIVKISNAVPFSNKCKLTGDLNYKDSHWSIVSRLDQLKIPGIIDFLVKAKNAGVSGCDVFGDGPAKDVLLYKISQLGLVDYVTLHGFNDNILEVIKNSAGVAGMGRVVLEGITCKRPVVLVGYDGVKGIIDKDFLELSADSNFSGRGLPTINFKKFVEQLEMASSKNIQAVYDHAKISFDETACWSLFLEHVTSLAPKTRTLLSGLFFSLSSEPVEGDVPYLHSMEVIDRLSAIVCAEKYFNPRISVALLLCVQRVDRANSKQTVIDLDRQIADLNLVLFKLNAQVLDFEELLRAPNEQVVDFEGLLSARDAQVVDFEKLLRARDEQIVNLNKNITECNLQIDNLKKAVLERDVSFQGFLNSHSWRITSPLRSISTIIKSIGNEDHRYAFLKKIYWRLPIWAKNRLNKTRYYYVARRFNKKIIRKLEDAPLNNLQDYAQNEEWVRWANKSQKLLIIPCSFEFNELVNQRPINAAKYFAENGWKVIFVAWQWTEEEILSKGCCEVLKNIYQVPLYNFAKHISALTSPEYEAVFIATFPAPILVGFVYDLREKGFAIIYDIMDEWEKFSQVGQASWYKKSIENRLVLEADFVFAVSPPLVEKFCVLRRDINLIGNGYTAEVLGLNNRNIAGSEGIEEIAGYFGHLTDAWFDWDLIFIIAEKRPEIIFEIIGYGEPDWVNKKILSFKNIRLIGKVLPANLHKYVSRWAVGIIPFVEGTLAEAVDPIKIYEYLYFGLPSVVTGICHIQNYPMTFYAQRNNFVDILENALSMVADSDQIDDFLCQTTWNARFENMISKINCEISIKDLYAG